MISQIIKLLPLYLESWVKDQSSLQGLGHSGKAERSTKQQRTPQTADLPMWPCSPVAANLFHFPSVILP